MGGSHGWHRRPGKRTRNLIGECKGNRILKDLYDEWWNNTKCILKSRTGWFGLYLWCVRGLGCMLF